LSSDTHNPPPLIHTTPHITMASKTRVEEFHSMIRWSKPVADVEAFAKANPSVLKDADAGNGNHAIHIAAQNDHRPLVELLLKLKVDVNSQNGTGQTALHMSQAYDYYWTAKILTASGANPGIENNDGHKACAGIEGDKDDKNYVAALSSAADGVELAAALVLLQNAPAGSIEKGSLVMEGMKARKRLKAMGAWTAEFNTKYTAFVKAL